MVGEFKDDRVQFHRHYIPSLQGGAGVGQVGVGSLNSYTSPYNLATSENMALINARQGDTTRTKQKGVKYIIKVL